MTQSLKLDPLADFLRASTPLELKFASGDAEAGIVEGIASHFGGEADAYGDVIAPGAYTKSLAEHAREGSLPFMLWQHDPATPIGRWTECKQTGIGLQVRGKLNLETEPGKRAHAHLKAGDIRGLSIGYAIYPGGYENNRNGTRTLTAIDLKEISLVTMPAQRRAAVTGVKSSFNSRGELEAILRDVLPGRAVKKLLAGGWQALSAADELPEDPALKQLLLTLKSATHELKG